MQNEVNNYVILNNINAHIFPVFREHFYLLQRLCIYWKLSNSNPKQLYYCDLKNIRQES